MKQLFSALIMLFSGILTAFAQEEAYQLYLDSIEQTIRYEKGTIELSNGVGKILVPDGFKYLDAQQAENILVNVWGNPYYEHMTLGMLLREDQKVTGMDGYVFNIEYDEIGYVKDKDADKINYDDLLKDLQKETKAANEERVKQGYEPVEIVGWAAKPFYDKEHKILHWAKELKFGESELNTLNYNIRILGRKGVLELNAISTVNELSLVEKDLKHVLNIVQFNDGYKYKDFDPSVDEVASWTIGGLVAGKVLAKAGFFALLLKFWKFIAVGAVALGGLVMKKIRGEKEEEITEA